MEKKLNILVTNDDGIDSPGILALAKSLERLGKVTVAAPDRQQSAVGHSLTISNPLRVVRFKREGDVFGYAINGTPSDCVKLAIYELLETKPDLVVSGINHGQNTAINILYSGTVAAATEGMLEGIPSLAISLATHNINADLSAAAEYAYIIAKKMLDFDMPKGTLMNANVPVLPFEEIKGIKATRASSSFWKDTYEKRTDPFGREYYWFAGEYTVPETDINSDDAALKAGYVTLTPVHFEFTNLECLSRMSAFE